MYFVFVTKTKCKSVSRNSGKIIVTGKEMSKLFSFDYLTMHYNMVKYRRNAEKRLILSLLEENMMDFDYHEEYLTSILNKILSWQC